MYVFLDYDGTLVKTREEEFTRVYFIELAKKAGEEPKKLGNLVMGIIEDMMKNQTGEKDLFHQFVEMIASRSSKPQSYWIDLFFDFYKNDFEKLREFVEPNDELLESIKASGKKFIFASNPIFPEVAVVKRLSFIGLKPEDFIYVAHMENSHFMKPHPGFFKEILDKINTDPERCVFIGDSDFDKACEKVGIEFIHVEERERWKKLLNE